MSVKLNGFLKRIVNWYRFYKAQCAVTCKVLQLVLLWYAMSIALLPGVRITSEICLLTATLPDGLPRNFY